MVTIKSFGSCLALLILCAPAAALARVEYQTPYATCTPAYQTVSVGGVAHFFAESNTNGPYTWVVEDKYSVRDLDAEFFAELKDPGVQRVALVWGSKRSYCTVEVLSGYGYEYDAGYSNQYATSPLNITLQSVLYPLWPNAGFGPQTYAALAFALVLLLGVGIALYPHARKAFAIVTR